MSSIFDKEKIMQPNIAIHCKTLEEATKLTAWAHSQHLEWANRDVYTDTKWERNTTTTCYDINSGKIGSVTRCKYKGYTILAYKEARKPKPLDLSAILRSI